VDVVSVVHVGWVVDKCYWGVFSEASVGGFVVVEVSGYLG
jgi:hypothetical protein